MIEGTGEGEGGGGSVLISPSTGGPSRHFGHPLPLNLPDPSPKGVRPDVHLADMHSGPPRWPSG